MLGSIPTLALLVLSFDISNLPAPQRAGSSPAGPPRSARCPCHLLPERGVEMESRCLGRPPPTQHILPGSWPAVWSSSLTSCRGLAQMLVLSEEIPIPAEILATQKRNPSENSPATMPGSGEAATSTWSSSAHILLLASCIPHPLSCIPQLTSCSLHSASCNLKSVRCIHQPSSRILYPTSFLQQPAIPQPAP